jgi:hypothetical protein
MLEFFARGRRRAKATASPKRGSNRFRPGLEALETRLLPVSTLQIGQLESFSFLNSGGLEVQVQVAGSAGQAVLVERAGDGAGDDDGVLEDGEEIGSVEISGASSDFSLTFTTDPESSGVVHLGDITARDQTIAGIFTHGPAVFSLRSFMGQDFSPGGGLFVDGLLDRLDLARLSDDTTIKVRGELGGRVTIASDLAGTLDIGGPWTGSLTVGGNLLGSIEAKGDALGAVRVIGDFNGVATAAGSISAKWLIVGSLNGNIRATADLRHVFITRDFTGSVVAGGELRLDVGGWAYQDSRIEASLTEARSMGRLSSSHPKRRFAICPITPPARSSPACLTSSPRLDCTA